MAQRMDLNELRLVEDPILLGDHVLYNRFNGRAIFGVSQNGVLAYRTASMSKLVWLDRNGRELRSLGSPDHYADPLLSPDEARVAVARPNPRTAIPDIWFIDSERGGGSQFTFDPTFDVMPLWSADGREIIFSSNREGFFDLYRKGSGSGSREEVLFKSDSNKWPLDWSRDGRHVMYFQSISNDARTPSGLWALPLIGDRMAHRLGPYEYGQFSPDGRWIAYHAGPAEHTEVYVESFLGVGQA
jgi:Tol biopolymer transport system component